MSLYFKDNFFNAGRTDIMNRQGEVIGELDLKSAFGSSVDVYDAARDRVCSGSFRFFSNRWNVRDHNDQELGVLRMRMSFMKKRFEYDAGPAGRLRLYRQPFPTNMK
ncbi:hypothetical protein [Paenibacillus sp. JCM 10914]|uniref:hypothetical protein n=1 Tax=Paenibacillus sp. JCM 10914 TaxID=1236974 RepID=UPI0003CC5550|nr:hypothetical protein JCM10914_4046 [Paenibacillus sp. JCM 10914]